MTINLQCAHPALTKLLPSATLFGALLAGCSEPGVFVDGLQERSESTCSDRIDNDRDGDTDCDDSSCRSLPICNNSGGPDATTPTADPDGASPADGGDKPLWPTCASATGEATLVAGEGVDIIWAIDTSASMIEEVVAVVQNINDFAKYIATQKIDYRVIMIGVQPPFPFLPQICIPPPLGGPNCADGPRYRHIREEIGSSDSLEIIVKTYPEWRDFLRPKATKNFVVVSDDNSGREVAWFEAELAKLDKPGFGQGFVFHSIVAFGPDKRKGCWSGAEIGQVYLDLTQKSGGSKFPVCTTDWKPVFSQLAQSVVQNIKPPCSYKMPAPPKGKEINPKQIRVSHIDGGQTKQVDRVDNKAACDKTGGFFYDDARDPTIVTFCPTTCQAIDTGKIEIIFGCLKDIQ